MITKGMHSFPGDVWALGCVFYQMATLEHPFGEDLNGEVLNEAIVNKQQRHIKGVYSG